MRIKHLMMRVNTINIHANSKLACLKIFSQRKSLAVTVINQAKAQGYRKKKKEVLATIQNSFQRQNFNYTLLCRPERNHIFLAKPILKGSSNITLRSHLDKYCRVLSITPPFKISSQLTQLYKLVNQIEAYYLQLGKTLSQ